MFIANLGKALLSKDGIGIEIVLEFQEVVGGIFEEKREVLNGFSGESTLGLTKKCQLILCCPISQLSPFFLCLAYEPKVSGINIFLRLPQVLCDLSHELVAMKI